MPDTERQLDLAERARDGDAAAQSALLEELYPVVHKHLGFVLGDRSLVEEAVQESILEIYRSLASFRYRVSVRAWALKIATRRARRFAAMQSRHRAALTDDGAVPEIGSAPEHEARADLRRLQVFLGELSAKKREAFVLMEVLELSAREAGEALGTFANTAASRARHAKQEIVARFAEPEGVQEAAG